MCRLPLFFLHSNYFSLCRFSFLLQLILGSSRIRANDDLRISFLYPLLYPMLLCLFIFYILPYVFGFYSILRLLFAELFVEVAGDGFT